MINKAAVEMKSTHVVFWYASDAPLEANFMLLYMFKRYLNWNNLGVKVKFGIKNYVSKSYFTFLNNATETRYPNEDFLGFYSATSIKVIHYSKIN
jgi:hypothetical protein